MRRTSSDTTARSAHVPVRRAASPPPPRRAAAAPLQGERQTAQKIVGQRRSLRHSRGSGARGSSRCPHHRSPPRQAQGSPPTHKHDHADKAYQSILKSIKSGLHAQHNRRRSTATAPLRQLQQHPAPPALPHPSRQCRRRRHAGAADAAARPCYPTASKHLNQGAQTEARTQRTSRCFPPRSCASNRHHSADALVPFSVTASARAHRAACLMPRICGRFDPPRHHCRVADCSASRLTFINARRRYDAALAHLGSCRPGTP
jgi:hypothetical protein